MNSGDTEFLDYAPEAAEAAKEDKGTVSFPCRRENLGLFFQAWGVPTRDAARQYSASLPGWMPPDWPKKVISAE